MNPEVHADVLDDIATYLRNMNDRAIYAAIGDDDIPEEAKVKLYGLIEQNDELADRLNQAAEIIREDNNE